MSATVSVSATVEYPNKVSLPSIKQHFETISNVVFPNKQTIIFEYPKGNIISITKKKDEFTVSGEKAYINKAFLEWIKQKTSKKPQLVNDDIKGPFYIASGNPMNPKPINYFGKTTFKTLKEAIEKATSLINNEKKEWTIQDDDSFDSTFSYEEKHPQWEFMTYFKTFSEKAIYFLTLDDMSQYINHCMHYTIFKE